MSRSTLACIVFLAVALCVVVYCLIGSVTGAHLVVPEELIIAEAEAWVYVSMPFSLTNSGNEQLNITSIESGCSCLGIEIDREGKRCRIDSLSIPPKETVPVYVCLQPRVNDGESTGVVVRFLSNDNVKPIQDLKVIISKVTGGVFAEPMVLQFGKVPVGKTESLEVQITDRSLNPRIIEQCSITSELFIIDKLEVNHLDIIDQSKKRVSTRIGKAKVSLRCDQPGSYTESIQVHLKGTNRPPLVIPVYAIVVDAVEVIPKRMVLPRRTDDGDSYAANLRVISTDQTPITSYHLAQCSFASVKASLESDKPSELLLSITVDPTKYVTGSTIQGHVVLDGKNHEFNIPVMILDRR